MIFGKIFKGFSKSHHESTSEKYFSNNLYMIDNLSDKEKFDNILVFAEEIINTTIDRNVKQHPILDLIRIIGRRLQSDYMGYLLYSGKERSEFMNLEAREVFFNIYDSILDENNNYVKVDKLIEIKYNNKPIINLSTDFVLPWPWHRTRMKDSILNIGEGRPSGKWEQDYDNHWLNVWLPMGIVWVGGGNHSITVGIVQGGEVEPEYCSDISKLYKYIKCDGKNFIEINSGRVISKVQSPEFAAIFEIGRLMVDRRISFIK